MGLTIAQKIIKNHLVSGKMIPGTEIGLRIDQTLTQDATGTMAYLEFEAMGIDSVKTELILTITLFRPALKTLTIIVLFKAVQKNAACCFQNPVTESAIRFTLSVSEFRVKRSSVQTAILLPEEVLE